MEAKKVLCRFTLQFNPADPCHQEIIQTLNQQGRRKAQFLVNAVSHYLHCGKTPSIPQPAPIDTSLIESIVYDILEKQGMPQQLPPQTSTVQKPPPAAISKNKQGLSPESMAAIAASLASFRK